MLDSFLCNDGSSIPMWSCSQLSSWVVRLDGNGSCTNFYWQLSGGLERYLQIAFEVEDSL